MRFEAILNSLINDSIQKVFVSGIMVYDYRIDKFELGRQRMTDQLVAEVYAVCQERDVGCQYVESRAAFDIQINLKTCRLSFTQSSHLSSALAATYVGD